MYKKPTYSNRQKCQVITTLLACLAVLSILHKEGFAAEDDAKAKLSRVQEQIRHISAELARAQGRAGKLELELGEAETKIGRINRKLLEIEQQRKALQRKQQRLTQRRMQLEQDLTRQRNALARQLRVAYATGRQEKLKLWLNQQDPSAIGRNLVYYEYLNRMRIEQIAYVNDTLASLRSVLVNLEENATEIERLSLELQSQRQSLQQSRSERNAALAALKEEIQEHNLSLDRLNSQQRELRELVDALQQVLADIPEQPSDRKSFRELKGRLPWPTEGKILNRFGRQRSPGIGSIKWHGVLIRAKPNQEVHAVWRGRVAFADWMRGYGLLVIIDHGKEYMSLYGHNQSLYRSVGDWVEKGEMIARVGDTGGQDSVGLYFELRHRGTPIDPTKWCSSKVKMALTPAGMQ